MVCVPAVSDEVENVATPLPFKVTGEPRFVPLSLNCAVPVGVPAVDETVAGKGPVSQNSKGDRLIGFGDVEALRDISRGVEVAVACLSSRDRARAGTR